MQLEDTLFDVHEEPVFTKDGEQQPYKQIVQSNTGKTLAIHSADYQLVTNKEVLDSVEPIMDYFGGKLHRVRNFANRRFFWEYRLDDRIVTINSSDISNDEIIPRIIVSNSYDGQVIFRLNIAAMRLICTNGMMAPMPGKEKVDIKLKHYNEAIDMNQIFIEGKAGVNTMLNQFDASQEIFEMMADRKATPDEIQKIMQLFGKGYHKEFINCVGIEGHETLWNVYNAGTRLITHYMLSERALKLENDLFLTINRWLN